MFGGEKRGVETAESAAARSQVREKRKVKKAVSLGAICGDKRLIRDRLHSFDHALDQRAAKEKFERLVLSHARGLPAGLNDNT